jgi:uncharacterized caspase-like protein
VSSIGRRYDLNQRRIVAGGAPAADEANGQRRRRVLVASRNSGPQRVWLDRSFNAASFGAEPGAIDLGIEARAQQLERDKLVELSVGSACEKDARHAAAPELAHERMRASRAGHPAVRPNLQRALPRQDHGLDGSISTRSTMECSSSQIGACLAHWRMASGFPRTWR